VEEVFHFGPRWRHLAMGLVKNGFYAITSELFNFFNLFFASVLCYQHENLMQDFFEKIIVGGLFLNFWFQQLSLVFSKTFLPLNLRADNTKLMQKTDCKKCWILSKLWQKNNLPLGKWRHLEPK
jgi:hypothetical protein